MNCTINTLRRCIPLTLYTVPKVREKFPFHRIRIFICSKQININPVNMYLLKVDNKHVGTRCEICSKLILKTSKWGQLILCFHPTGLLSLRSNFHIG